MTSLNPVLPIGHANRKKPFGPHEPGLPRSVVNRRVIAALEQAAVPEPEVRANNFRINFPEACGNAP